MRASVIATWYFPGLGHHEEGVGDGETGERGERAGSAGAPRPTKGLCAGAGQERELGAVKNTLAFRVKTSPKAIDRYSVFNIL